MNGWDRLREGARAGRPLLLIAGLFAAGTVVTWLAVTQLAYATGVAGTSGYLRVEACSWSYTGGHRYPHCHGTFRSADGTVVDPDATIDTGLPVGGTVALQRTASAGYEQTGVGASFGWLALSLFGLMVLVLGTLLVRARSGARGRPGALLVLLGVLGAVMLLSAFIGGVAGVVEAF
ncbi:hypothetical protein [Streptomyces sp. NPDC005251]|uniref:hypothetical protein n=1 Tax=unclassified Streptomyces TaxID=2593676 RepID=UPI0033A183D1